MFFAGIPFFSAHSLPIFPTPSFCSFEILRVCRASHLSENIQKQARIAVCRNLHCVPSSRNRFTESLTIYLAENCLANRLRHLNSTSTFQRGRLVQGIFVVEITYYLFVNSCVCYVCLYILLPRSFPEWYASTSNSLHQHLGKTTNHVPGAP